MGGTSVGAILENPNEVGWVAERVDITITGFDAAGAVVGNQRDSVSAVLPGQRVGITTQLFDAATTSEIDVQFRVGDWREIDFEVGSYGFAGVATTPQKFGGVVTRGTISSTFEEEQSNVRLTAIYLDAEGGVMGGEFTFADFVPNVDGGDVGFEVTSFCDYPGLATTEVFAEVGFGN